MSLAEFFRMFPDDTTAEQWFIKQRWPNGIACPRDGSLNIQLKTTHPQMPFRCRDCRKFFSVRTGTALEHGKVPYQKALLAMFQLSEHPKGVSSIQLGKDLGVRQATAWALAHRIRQGFTNSLASLEGPLEADEAYIGGREKNKHACKKGLTPKAIVVGLKDRATNTVTAKFVGTGDPTLEMVRPFVYSHRPIGKDQMLYTDGSPLYHGSVDHEAVNHKAGEYVRGEAHTNGMESFWALFKRGFHGTYHKMSNKHLPRYLREFTGRHAARPLKTLDRLRFLWLGLEDRFLPYEELKKKK
jgi:transposase-like protein